MSYSYIQAIGEGFPNVHVHCQGDGTNYEDLVHDGGDPIPLKEVLDQWIADRVQQTSLEITRLEFRRLFTLLERVAIDGFANNPTIPDNYKAILTTVMKDLDAATSIRLDDPDTIAGVTLLAGVGLITAERAQQVLSKTPPPQSP